VLFAWDEKRSGDVVYAAGWNAKVGQPKTVQVAAAGQKFMPRWCSYQHH